MSSASCGRRWANGARSSDDNQVGPVLGEHQLCRIGGDDLNLPAVESSGGEGVPLLIGKHFVWLQHHDLVLPVLEETFGIGSVTPAEDQCVSFRKGGQKVCRRRCLGEPVHRERRRLAVTEAVEFAGTGGDDQFAIADQSVHRGPVDLGSER